MMNEFWTTVLSTAGASAIISGIITSAASILLQHRYNKKIESFKADLSKMLNEDQTKFNWWYLEKAKAIKIIYSNLADMKCLLYQLHSIDTDPKWKTNQHYQEEMREKTYQEFLVASEVNLKDWLRLRLFFDAKDDITIAKNVKGETDFFSFYVNKITKDELDDLAIKGPEMLYEIETMMTHLRNDFQITLGVQKRKAEDSSPQESVNASSKQEAK